MANTFDPSGANNMAAIKDRITKTLSDATRDMTPLETLGNIGRAAAQAATGHTTFGDVMNAQNAQRLKAAEQMMGVLQQERQLELQERAGERDVERMGLERDRFGLQQDQLALQQQQFEASERRAAGEERRAKDRLSIDQGNLELSRAKHIWEKLKYGEAQDEAARTFVVNAVEKLVPEAQRMFVAEGLFDLSDDPGWVLGPVGPDNAMAAIGYVRRKLAESGGLPEEGADFKDVTTLRKNFEDLAGNFISVRDSYGTMLGLADQLGPTGEYQDPANTGPGDLSFIFAYMKMLDPTSAVREGEQATAQNARGIDGGIRNIYNQIINGAKLTAAQRRGFLNQATALYRERQGRYDDLAEGYTRIAKDFKMDPANVVLDFAGPYRYRAMDDEELAAAAESASSPAAAKAIEEEFNRRLAGEQ